MQRTRQVALALRRVKITGTCLIDRYLLPVDESSMRFLKAILALARKGSRERRSEERNYGTALSSRSLSHAIRQRESRTLNISRCLSFGPFLLRRRSLATSLFSASRASSRLLILRSVARDEGERIIAVRGSGLSDWLRGGYWHRAVTSLTTTSQSLLPCRCCSIRRRSSAPENILGKSIRRILATSRSDSHCCRFYLTLRAIRWPETAAI